MRNISAGVTLVFHLYDLAVSEIVRERYAWGRIAFRLQPEQIHRGHNLRQKDLAKHFGVHRATVRNWEQNQKTPGVRFIPRIVAFIGYALYDAQAPLRERLRTRREALGLSQAKFARLLGVDESTVRKWEQGVHRPDRKSEVLLQQLVFVQISMGQ